MAAYNKKDFENGSNVLDNLNSFKSNLDDLKSKISILSLNAKLYLQGDAANTYLKQLSDNYTELSSTSKKIGLIVDLKSNNAAVCSAFGSDCDSISQDQIDEIKKKIDKANLIISNLEKSILRFFKVPSMRNYLIKQITKSQEDLKELTEIYKKLKKILSDVEAADSVSVNITI